MMILLQTLEYADIVTPTRDNNPPGESNPLWRNCPIVIVAAILFALDCGCQRVGVPNEAPRRQRRL